MAEERTNEIHHCLSWRPWSGRPALFQHYNGVNICPAGVLPILLKAKAPKYLAENYTASKELTRKGVICKEKMPT